jgi:hypothetical protein
MVPGIMVNRAHCEPPRLGSWRPLWLALGDSRESRRTVECSWQSRVGVLVGGQQEPAWTCVNGRRHGHYPGSVASRRNLRKGGKDRKR